MQIHHQKLQRCPVMAGAANVSPMRDALMAETMACQFALEAAEMHGISRIELETDSALLREA
jgi:ribonuclease HI